MEEITGVKIRSKILENLQVHRDEKVDIIKLELKARGFEDIDLLAKLESPELEIRLDAIKRLVIRTVKEALPNATDEELSIFIMNNVAVINEAVMELNNVKPKDKIENGTRT